MRRRVSKRLAVNIPPEVKPRVQRIIYYCMPCDRAWTARKVGEAWWDEITDRCAKCKKVGQETWRYDEVAW